MLESGHGSLRRNRISEYSQSISFKCLWITKKKIITSHWRNTQGTTSAEWSRLVPAVIRITHTTHPRAWCTDNNPSALFFPKLWSSVSSWEHTRQTQREGHPPNTWAASYSVMVTKDKKQLRNHLSLGGPEDQVASVDGAWAGPQDTQRITAAKLQAPRRLCVIGSAVTTHIS